MSFCCAVPAEIVCGLFHISIACAATGILGITGHDVISVSRCAMAMSALSILTWLASARIFITSGTCAFIRLTVLGIAATVGVNCISAAAFAYLAGIVFQRAVIEILFAQGAIHDAWQSGASRNDAGIFVIIEDFAAVFGASTDTACIADFFVSIAGTVFRAAAADGGAGSVAVHCASGFIGIDMIIGDAFRDLAGSGNAAGGCHVTESVTIGGRTACR